MSIELSDIEIGDIVTYFVGREMRRVIVETVEVDIKNGISGFSGYTIDWDNNPTKSFFKNETRNNVWGYLDQVVDVEKQNVSATE